MNEQRGKVVVDEQSGSKSDRCMVSLNDVTIVKTKSMNLRKDRGNSHSLKFLSRFFQRSGQFCQATMYLSHLERLDIIPIRLARYTAQVLQCGSQGPLINQSAVTSHETHLKWLGVRTTRA